MRIVSWNCAMAFRNKWRYAASFDPDVIVAPEAEEPARQPADLTESFPHVAWTGTLPTKGLLSVSRHVFAAGADRASDAHHVLPIEIGGERSLRVLGVWTQRDASGGYTRHLARALQDLEEWLVGDCIVVGDFNANAIWDDDHRNDVTHSQNVEWLRARGFESLYHQQTGEPQGAETAMTHAFRRHADEPFHIDYCFASQSLREASCAIQIRPVEEWIGLSDHAPLVIDIA